MAQAAPVLCPFSPSGLQDCCAVGESMGADMLVQRALSPRDLHGSPHSRLASLPAWGPRAGQEDQQ